MGPKSCWGQGLQTKSQVLNLEVADHVTLAAKALLHVKFKLQTKKGERWQMLPDAHAESV